MLSHQKVFQSMKIISHVLALFGIATIILSVVSHMIDVTMKIEMNPPERREAIKFFETSSVTYKMNELRPVITRIHYRLDDMDYHNVTQFGEKKCKIPWIDTSKMDGSYDLMEFSGVGVSSHGFFLKSGVLYARDFLCNWLPTRVEFKVMPPVNEDYIVVSHNAGNIYGHWIHEVFARILVTPESLRMNSTFILPELEPWAMNHIRMIDGNIKVKFSDQRIIHRPRKVYYINSASCCHSDPHLIQITRKWFVHKLELDRKAPFRFIVYQRSVPRRRMSNHLDLLRLFKEKFPQYHWEEAAEPHGLNESIRYWNEVKFYFGIHGGQMSNILFMQPGSVVLEIIDSRCYPCFIYPGVYSGLHIFQYLDERFDYDSQAELHMNETLMLEMVSESLRRSGILTTSQE